MKNSRTFYHIDHQGKGKAYRLALLDAGWQEVWDEKAGATICLADSDVTPFRRQRLDGIAEKGTRIFLYPHSARPPFFYDFPGFVPHPKVTARFVTARGHLDYLRIIGIENNVHLAGWSFCPILEFSQSLSVATVLFAPLHANANGWLSEEDKLMNQLVCSKLVLLLRSGKISSLSVRHLDNLKLSGLEKVSGVDYYQGRPDQSYIEIDRADLVVATETFAYLAAARGKPVIMFGEDRPPRYGGSSETYGYVHNWSSYKDLVRFPIDISDHGNTWSIVEGAIFNSTAVQEWKDRMIGDQFDTREFLRIIESYL